MADMEITMVVKVDLECDICNKKIRRVLLKIKDKMNIDTISFDEERNLVTISGPFDAEKVRRKLGCEAGWIIKGFDVRAPEEKKTEEKTTDGGLEKEEGRNTAAAAPAVNLRPLLEKMLERPKARTQPACCTCCCRCSCGKKTTQPPAAQVVVPAPASSVYGVPVYSIEGW